MWKVNQTITSNLHTTFSSAHARLPRAHHVAQLAGMNHLHGVATRAAEDAGLDAEPLVMHWRGGVPHVAIERSEAGDRLADHEFGTPATSPSPVLRNAVRKAHPEANAIYGHVLRRELGF